MSGARALLMAGLLTLAPFVLQAQVWERYLDGYHGPYRGRVIDAETKQPLAGAVVVAIWDREQVRPLLGPATVFHEAREAMTNANGEFVLHAEDIESNAPLKTLRPYFILFSPGYGRYRTVQRPSQRNLFEGEGTVLALPRLKTREERLDTVSLARLGVGSVPRQKIPNLIRLVNREAVDLGLTPYPERDTGDTRR